MRFQNIEPSYVYSIDDLLRICVEREGSDLHLVAGTPPCIRVNGEIIRLDAPSLSDTDMEGLIIPILKDYQRLNLEKDYELDFSYSIPGCARFRGNIMFQRERLQQLSGQYRLPYLILKSSVFLKTLKGYALFHAV